jgi:hypothetical protein
VTPAGPDAPSPQGVIRKDLEYPDYVQVMSTPVVMRLHAKDAEPAVVFNAFPERPPGLLQGSEMVEVQGVMRAVRGSDGSPIWTAPKDMFQHMELSVDGNSGIAAGDCMGTGESCFITGGWDPTDEPPRVSDSSKAHQHGGLIAFGSDGRLLWVTREAQVWWGAPVIARLLGPTGSAQVVVGNGVFDGATGKTLCAQNNNGGAIGGNGDGSLTAIADLDLDGIPEIITGNQALKLVADATSATGYTCKPMFGEGVKMPRNLPCPGGTGSFCPEGFPAVANFAKYGAAMGLKPDDPHPQVVVVSKGFRRSGRSVDPTTTRAALPPSRTSTATACRRSAWPRRAPTRSGSRAWAGSGARRRSTARPTPVAPSSTSRARARRRWSIRTSASSTSSMASRGRC